MKVKVEDRIYDGEIEPVMVILTDKDKENIKNMHPECSRYCVYPTIGITSDDVEKWMKG